MLKYKRAKRTTETPSSIATTKGPLSFLLKRSSRRRTLAIVVGEDANVIVHAPFYSTLKAIHSFINEKTYWIFDKKHEAEKNISYLNSKKFDEGHEFLFLGKKYPINIKDGDTKTSRISFDGLKWDVTFANNLNAHKKRDTVKKKMVQWYRKQAEEVLGGRIFYYSRIMGVEPKKIAVRSQKRLWGCCDFNTQTIHLNWQIILSPIKVVDYVVVHEMCHLMIPNHSKRFWKKVEKYMPDFKQYQKWLKINALDMLLP